MMKKIQPKNDEEKEIDPDGILAPEDAVVSVPAEEDIDLPILDDEETEEDDDLAIESFDDVDDL